MDFKESLFIDKLNELKNNAEDLGGVVTSEDIKDAFKDMNLTKEQYDLVSVYLSNAGISVDGEAPASENENQEDVRYIDMYLQELDELPKIDDDTIKTYLLRLYNGEKDMIDAIILAYLPKVVDLTRLYIGQGTPIEDLIGEGNVALATVLNSLKTQDDFQNADDIIIQSVMAAMEEICYQDNENSALGNEWSQRADMVYNKAKAMSEGLERKVTKAEVATELSISVEDLEDILKMAGSIEFITEE